jgi:O-antigen/teichoic acid export membrane protein
MKVKLANKYVANLVWSFFEKVIHLISVVVIGVLLARYLGPENFGILTYTQSYIAMFSFVVGLGMDSITIREIVKHSDKSDVIVGTVFTLKVIMAVLVIIIINIGNYELNDSKQINLLITIFSLSLLHQAFYVFVNYFQAIVNIRFISVFVVVSDLISIVVKLLLINYNSSLFAFILTDTILLIILGVCYFYIYKNSKKLKFYKLFQFDFSLAKKMLKDSWPLMISSGAIMLYMRLDQLMIKEMLSLKDLGNYAISVRISEAWYFIPMIISGVLYPSIIQAKESNVDVYNMRLKQLFLITIWLAIFCAFFLLIFSDYIISFLFGNQYSKDNNVLPILAFAGIFVSMGYVNGKWMIAENYTKIELLRNVLGLGINVLLNIILIPRYGIDGAAISTLISIFVAADLVFFFYKKTRKMFYIQNTSFLSLKVLKRAVKHRF